MMNSFHRLRVFVLLFFLLYLCVPKKIWVGITHHKVFKSADKVCQHFPQSISVYIKIEEVLLEIACV